MARLSLHLVGIYGALGPFVDYQNRKKPTAATKTTHAPQKTEAATQHGCGLSHFPYSLFPIPCL